MGVMTGRTLIVTMGDDSNSILGNLAVMFQFFLQRIKWFLETLILEPF